jgi:hypothetical protein
VRTAAAQSLGEIGDERAIGPLARACTDPDLRYNTFLSTRYVVAEALASFGSRAVEPVLQVAEEYIALAEAPSQEQEYLRKLKNEVLAKTLAALGDPRVIPPLTRLAAIDPYHYRTAITGQGSAEGPDGEATDGTPLTQHDLPIFANPSRTMMPIQNGVGSGRYCFRKHDPAVIGVLVL